MKNAVSSRVFCAVVTDQLSLHQDLMEMILALIDALEERQILTPELWLKTLLRAQRSKQAVKARKALQRLAGIQESEAIAKMLRDFSGPIQ